MTPDNQIPVSETPRTDDFCSKIILSEKDRVIDAFNKVNLRNFACTLERELNAANKEIERLKTEVEYCRGHHTDTILPDELDPTKRKYGPIDFL